MPTVVSLSLAAFMAASAPAAEPTESTQSFDMLLSSAVTYKYGQSRSALLALEKMVQETVGDTEARDLMASKMAAALSAAITPDCKKFLCRQLSLIGSGKHVPALAALLSDDKLGLAARSALERIPGDDAVVAMRTALSKSSGPTALGLIDTLGKRRDAKAVAMIAAFVRDKDPVVAAGAADALGKIGGKEAMELLMKADAEVGGDVLLAVNHALLACADKLAKEGKAALTVDVYKTLTDPERPAHVKLAAFPGLIACRGKKGASLVLDALTGDDAAMQSAAIVSLRTFGGKDLIVAMSKELPGLDPKAQVQIVNAFSERGESAVLPAVQDLLKSDRKEVKTAAVAALGALGDATTVGVLSGLLPDADLGKAAFGSLSRIEAPGVEDAMIAVLQNSSPAEKAQMAAVLRQRDAAGASPALMKAAMDGDAKVRKEALKALGALASASDCDGLIRLLDKPGSVGDMRSVQSTLVALCGRHASVRDSIAKAAERASGPARVSLLSILGKTGGGEALRVLKEALKDPDKGIRTAAIKAVSDWPDAKPLPDLVAFLRAEKELTPKALAFRAFVGLSGKDPSASPDEAGALYTEVMALADRPEDRKTLVGGMGSVPSPDALKLAVSCLGDSRTVNEAALAVVQIAPHLLASHGKEVKAAMGAVLEACELKTVRAKAKDILIQLSKPMNLARSATASSPDGLEKDGNAGGDQAAIDGNPNTYWDEVDNRKLYILQLDFRRAVRATDIAIMGYQHHGYAPRDFEIVCDGKTVKTIVNAEYTNNRLHVSIPPTTFKCLALKITKSYGPSPAIRELEIYNVEPSEGNGN